MKYKDLPFNTYFKFTNNEYNHEKPWCKISDKKIREFGDNTDNYTLWHKLNEEVVDMGSYNKLLKDLYRLFRFNS